MSKLFDIKCLAIDSLKALPPLGYLPLKNLKKKRIFDTIFKVHSMKNWRDASRHYQNMSKFRFSEILPF